MTKPTLNCLAVGLFALLASHCSSQPSSPPPSPGAGSAVSSASIVVGKGPRASSGFPAIIVLEPQTPRDFPVPKEPKVMDQQNTTFTPALLLVQQGQQVVFRNSEDILHNVRVGETGSNQPVFNVATVPLNSYAHTFDRPGFYNVGCDVHPTMHADIFVTASPWAVIADEDGRFTLSDVPPGSYKITAHLGGKKIERQVEVTGTRTEVVVGTE